MDGKAKRDTSDFYDDFIFSKSLLIAISVTDIFISLAGSSWWWQTSHSTTTSERSLHVNDLIFALALNIGVTSCQSIYHCFEILKVDTIDNITGACKLMKYFGLSIKKLKFTRTFREHLKGREWTLPRMIGEVCNHSNTFSVQTYLCRI